MSGNEIIELRGLQEMCSFKRFADMSYFMEDEKSTAADLGIWPNKQREAHI